MAASMLRDICFDCADNRRVAHFWAAVLGYDEEPTEPDQGAAESISITPTEGGPRIWFNAVPEPKQVKNRVHLDVTMSSEAELERLIALGAHPLQEIRGDDGVLWWTIMADPEGNEFCAFPPKR